MQWVGATLDRKSKREAQKLEARVVKSSGGSKANSISSTGTCTTFYNPLPSCTLTMLTLLPRLLDNFWKWLTQLLVLLALQQDPTIMFEFSAQLIENCSNLPLQLLCTGTCSFFHYHATLSTEVISVAITLIIASWKMVILPRVDSVLRWMRLLPNVLMHKQEQTEKYREFCWSFWIKWMVSMTQKLACRWH